MYHSLACRPRPRLLLVAAVGLLLATALPAHAGLVVTVQDVTAGAGTTGNALEVDLTNTGGAAVDIAAFSFEISVAPASGVSLTGARTGTSLDPYIFAGNSFANIVLSTVDISTATGLTLDASDAAFAGSTSLAGGSSVALGLVTFDVLGSTLAGPVDVTLAAYPATSLTDPNTDNIPIDTLTDGTITIVPSAVPEPSTFVLAGIAGVVGLGAWRRRKV